MLSVYSWLFTRSQYRHQSALSLNHGLHVHDPRFWPPPKGPDDLRRAATGVIVRIGNDTPSTRDLTRTQQWRKFGLCAK